LEVVTVVQYHLSIEMELSVDDALEQVRDTLELSLLKNLELCYYLDEKVDVEQKIIAPKLSNRSTTKKTAKNITKNITNRVLDSAILLGDMFCMYDATLMISNLGEERINDSVKSLLNRIYLSSSNYNTNNANNHNIDNSIKIKASPQQLCLNRNKRNNDNNIDDCSELQDLLHEFFVTTMFTNRLRRYIPSYAYTLGSLKLNTSKDIVCDLSNNQNNSNNCITNEPKHDTRQRIDYLLTDQIPTNTNVNNTMITLLKTCDVEDFLSWMTQIILALEMGVIHFGFTHYNLHPDNIVIQKPINDNAKSDFRYLYVKYYHDNEIWLVKANSIATICNYDMSHVRAWPRSNKHHSIIDYNTNNVDNIKFNPNFDGNNDTVTDDTDIIVVDDLHDSSKKVVHFGPIGYESLGIFETETRPFYDIYKLLMTSLNILRKHNPEVYGTARKLSKFFGFEYEHELVKALTTEEKSGYIYSKEISNMEKIRSIKEFIHFMQVEFLEVTEIKYNDILVRSTDFYEIPNTLNCRQFCPIASYYSDNSLAIKYKVDESSNSLLEFFSDLEDIMDRYYGLKRRVDEVKKLNRSLCNNTNEENNNNNSNGQECVISSDELLSITTEFKNYVLLILASIDNIQEGENKDNVRGGENKDNAMSIRDREVNSMEQLTEIINRLIAINNYDLQHNNKNDNSNDDNNDNNSFNNGIPVTKVNSRVLIRKQKEIESKVDILTRKYLVLQDFDREFELNNQRIPNIDLISMTY